MKQSRFVILVLLVARLAFTQDTGLPVYSDPQEPLDCGWLLFLRLPEPCEVFLDGEYQGRTPLLLSNLEDGTSLLTVKSASKIHSRRLRISEQSQEITHYTPQLHPYTGTFVLESDPPGAAVYLNDIEAGTTPVEIENLKSGEYRLSVLHPDYMPEHHLISVPRLDRLDFHLPLRPCVRVRFTPPLPQGTVAEVYDRSGALVTEGEVEQVLPVPAGYSRIVIRGELFHPQEIEVLSTEPEVTVAFNPVYYRPKLVFANLLDRSRIFVDEEDLTGGLQGNTLTVAPGSYVVTVATDRYLPFRREVTLAEDQEVPFVITNTRDPALIRKNRRIVILSTTLSGAALLVGSLALNLDGIAVPLSNSYDGYAALKYTTLGTGGLGIALVSTGIVMVLLK